MNPVERRAEAVLRTAYSDYMRYMSLAWEPDGARWYAPEAAEHYYDAGRMAWVLSGRFRACPIVPTPQGA